MSYRQNIFEKGNELKICAANGEGKVMKKFTVYHVKTNNSIVFYLFKATILFTLLVVSLIQPFAATGGTIPNGEICLCLIAFQLKDKQQNNARIFLPSCALDREKQYILYNSHVEEKTLPLETAAPPSKHNFQNAHFHIHTIIAQGNGKFVEFTSWWWYLIPRSAAKSAGMKKLMPFLSTFLRRRQQLLQSSIAKKCSR